MQYLRCQISVRGWKLTAVQFTAWPYKHSFKRQEDPVLISVPLNKQRVPPVIQQVPDLALPCVQNHTLRLFCFIIEIAQCCFTKQIWRMMSGD